MIVKDKEKTSQPIDTSLHYKMYKDGKHWVTAGITTLMFSGLILGTQTTAHADTAAASTSGDGQAQATTGGNAVTQTTASTASASSTNTDVASQPAANTVSATAAAASTATQSQSAGTITQPVAVNHSQLDQAVAAAKQAGLNPQQQPTTSSTVAPSEVDSAKANIESDYASQAAKLQEATDQQQTINKYNGSKGDSSALDAAVKEAQNTPGLTVKQDQTKTTSLKANDKSGIANWESNTAADYSSQVDAINKAIDAQKQNNTEYDQAMAKWKEANLNNNPNGLTTADVQQQLTLAAEPDAKVDIKILDSRASLTTSDRVFGGTTWTRVNLSTSIPGNIAQATYTNLKNSYYVDKNGQKHLIAKIVKTFSNTDYVASKSDVNIPLLDIATNPSMGVWYDGTSGVTETDTFYDANGNIINLSDNTAYIAVTSLNSIYESAKNGYTNGQFAISGLPLHIESATPVSNGKAYTLAGSSVTVHSNGALYADKTNNVTYQGGPNTDQTTWKSSTEDWESSAQYFGSGIIAVHGDSFSIRFETNFGDNDVNYNSGIWYTLDTIIPQTPTPTRKTTSVDYHYNVVNITPGVPDKDNVSYQYHDLNVATTPEKNWTQGSQVVNGKTEINDDVVSATVKMTTPAASQVEGGMKTLAVTDNYSKFANNVTYQGAQVYENDQLATSLYNVTNNAADATVTATRKDASTTPAGTVSLVVDFKINSDVPSGTKFENSGSGTINNSTVPTNDAEIVTYEQSAEKHWIEGTQTVDGKTYINDDVVTTKVDMSLPDPSTLAHSLTNVTVDDDYSDFQDKVTPQSYRVEENGKDVTSEYNVTYSNGHLTAVRKTPSTAPAGKVSLIATWLINANVASGTKLTNRGSGRINNHTVPTNTPDIKTYTQTADKHWVEGSQTVDDKTYVDGDEVHARVEMSLPDPATLAKPLTDVTLVDNYSDYADKVDYKSAQVLENGKDVTSQYTITNVGGKITAMRKAPGTAPAGTVQLLVNFKVKTGVASGTELNNYGSGRINNNTVATNNAKVVTYQQTTDKHWVDGTQIVDGKTYVDGDTINGQVSMSLPDPATLAKKLTKVAVTDDYSNFKDKVDYQEAHVYENGVDVTSQYNIVNNAGTGTVTATRKDAASAPKGTVVLTATWKVHDDVASGTKLINGGSGTINESTVKTPDRTIETWKQNKPVKHWVEGSQEVDGKVALDNDVISAQVTSDLPNPSDLAHKLSNVQVIDDYSQFKDHVKTSSIRVLENGVDVTSQYTIEDNAGTGIITASRKDPSTTPAGKVQMNVSFQINADTPSGTTFKNTPVSVINKSRVTGQEVTLTTYKQTTDKHWTEGSQVVDDKTYIASDTINARIEMSLPDPSTLTKKLTKVQLVDDYTQLAKYVSAPSDIRVEENGKDVTSEYSIATANGHITATRKDPSTTPAGTVALIAHFKVNADTPSGTKLVNAGSGTLNNETVPTNNPTVKTYTQTTDKHWTEGSQVVDGKVYIDASETHTDVTMSLPDPATLAKKLTKVAITDDYSKFAQYVDYESAQVLENGKDVSSEYTISVADGKVTATRKDASTTPAGTVDLHVNFKLHSDVASGTSLVNSGSGTINDETIATPDRTVKTYKQDTNKTWNVGDQTVNDKLVINNDQVQSTISMTLPDQNTLAKKLTKVQLVDDYSGLSKYADVKTVEIRENGKDVSSEYDVQNDGSHITATRKNAAGAPAGNVQMLVTWQVRADVPSGTQLENKGTGTLDDESVPTPSPKVVTYTPETDKHWVNGSQVVDGKTFIDGDQVSGKVTMSLPDPAQLAQPLSKVAITDDFSNFADKVDYKSAKVLENGKDVTSEYTISVANGKVVATRKNAAAAPKGTLELDVDWTVHTDVPSNTELVNTGSGTIDNDTVPTPKRTIVTYKQDTDKHWVSGGQNVDGKVAINDDNVTAQVNMTLPDKSKLGGSINKVQLTDDFSKFAKDVTVQAVHVYENGIDVTSEYDISIDPNGKVVATRKDPSKVNTAGNGSSTTVTMKANMKAADSLDASSLVAKASGNVNGQTSTTKTSMLLLAPTTDIAVENGQVKSQVNMSLPSDTSEVKNFAITDDYSDFSKYADASEVHVYENGTDATSKYAVTDNDGKVTATRKDMSDAEGGNVTMTVDYKLNHDIPNGTVLENHGSGTLNDETVPTNTPSITTYTQTADKHWVEGTQTVDGKVYIDGTLAHAQVTTSLPDPATLTDKLTDVSITDDYSAFADKVDFQSAQVLENGKDVTSEYTITKQGDKITATRKDPGSAPAGNAQLLLTFKIHSDVPSGTQLENVGSSTINNHTVSTNKATITTFKPDPKKDVVVSVDDNKSLNGANIDLNSSFDYKLEGSTVPKNSTGITEYGFHDDYDQEHDQYNGGYTVLLNSDVTLTDGTVLKKGTDVTKYTTQTIDQDNGIVDIEFDQDFLTKVDYAKSEFGATAYLKMKRVKAGDVENKYVNSINNQAFNSNTVKTHTDEPKPATPKNETPVTPQATTPETPLSPKTSQQPVFAAVQPAALQTASQSQTPSQGQQQLPQTGNDRDEALALTGLASLLFGLGTLGMKKRRRHA
ncbi:LPXTG cell wall anchor domain-containing protein [Limosilactobacillus allomucosae]|uniref:LPXTG cell wall anchor domain-containing protein n=1 Tax=Limosilactobacillus allomucosae TaxID=3142938 RepID=A0AAU7C5U7_9LACO